MGNDKTEAPQGSLSQAFLNKHANATLMISLTRRFSGQTVDATLSEGNFIKSTGHNVTARKWIVFTSGNLIGEEFYVTKVLDANGFFIDAKIDDVDIPDSETYDVYQAITPKTSSSGNFLVSGGAETVVDFLDIPTYTPSLAGDGIIPRLSSNAILLVASLATAVTRLQVVSDLGEFVNIYDDAARTNLLAHLVLTPDEIVDVDFAAGTALYFGAAKDVDIDDNNSIIQINFLG
jgi:hypothetical protein